VLSLPAAAQMAASPPQAAAPSADAKAGANARSAVRSARSHRGPPKLAANTATPLPAVADKVATAGDGPGLAASPSLPTSADGFEYER
jgi:hypothetical protein